MIRSCKEWLENVDKDKRNDRGGCADTTAKRQIIGHRGSIDNMPKQSKNKATASETERRRAEILHNRRVKEILEENERKRRPRYRVSMNPPNFDMLNRDKTLFNLKMRSGLKVYNSDGQERIAIRRPRGGVETNPYIIGALQNGAIMYVPEGLPGGVAGNPPLVFDFGDETVGSGKHKKKAGKAKRS